MNTNHVADVLLTKLGTIHSRVYRNAPPSSVIFPYIVIHDSSSLDAVPGHDYMIFIQVYDTPTSSVRGIHDIADDVEEILSGFVLSNTTANIRFEKVNRQFIPNVEVTKTKMIDLQYQARVYFK